MIVFALIALAAARETDQFSVRNMEHVDVIPEFNSYINNYFDTCSNYSTSKNLHEHCSSAISGIYIEDELEKLHMEKLYRIPVEDSIYGVKHVKSIVRMITKLSKLFQFAPSFSMKKHNTTIYIGMDKLGHFFDEGYKCYTLGYKGCVSFCKTSESTYFGLGVSGVYSYADVYTNLHGMEFWEALGTKYYTCDTISCSKREEIKLEDYFDAFMDESINVNKVILPWVKKATPYVVEGLQVDIKYKEGINPKLWDKVSHK